MFIVIVSQFKRNKTNHGPLFCIDCPNCHKECVFNFLSEKVVFKIWFVPLAEDDGASSIQCTNCKAELILSGNDIVQAIALNRYAATLHPQELNDLALDFLMEKFPIEALKAVMKANRQKQCPKCLSDVPEMFNCCWNCEFEF